MLDGLGHGAVIGGHYQHTHIDAADTRNHGVDKAPVPGHVNETQRPAPRAGQVGITEINGQPAAPFLLEAVGFDAGELLYQ